MNHATQKTRGKFSRQALPEPQEYYEKQGLKLIGGGLWRNAICPFHADTKPSLRVNIERGSFRCMACGTHGGDVLAFHMQKHKLGFIEACKQLGSWIGCK